MEYKNSYSGLFTRLIQTGTKTDHKTKHWREALAINLLMLGSAPASFGKGYQNYKHYMYLECGHKEYLQPTHVRRDNVKCTVCLENSYIEAAKNVGFTLLGKTESTYFREYKRDKCGHISTMRTMSINNRIGNSDIDCEECFDIKLKTIAEARNMTYLGYPEPRCGVFRKYMFNECGHERSINPACIARDVFICQECKENDYRQAAQEQGLVYIGTPDITGMKRKYLLPCGCTKDFRMSHVAEGSWCCFECEDTYYNKPSNVYLLHIKAPKFEWLKLGFAKNLKLRTTNYGLPKNSTVDLLFSKSFNRGIDALYFEKAIHTKLKEHRLSSSLMEQYHRFNGHTECYPFSALSNLLIELNKKEN